MSSKKEFTLTGKGTLTGVGYKYEKGAVISKDQYDQLSRKHQGYFEEGRIDLSTPAATPAAAKDKKDLEQLAERVTALEQLAERVTALEQLVGQLMQSGDDPSKTDKDTKTKK